MYEAGTWQAVAIAGSSPAAADIVEVIVVDATGQRLGKLDAARAEDGLDPLVSSHGGGELDRLAKEQHLSRLAVPVAVRPGDVALYVAPTLRAELERLGGAPVWPTEVIVADLLERSGVTVGLAPRPRLDEIRARWAAVLRREIDAQGVRRAEAPQGAEGERALGEIERLSRLALYCVDTKTLAAYELWLRIGLVQSRRFETVLLRRSYDVVIRRDYGVTREMFEADVETLAASFERAAREEGRRREAEKDVSEGGSAGPGLAKVAPFDPNILEHRLAGATRSSAPKASTTHPPLLRLVKD